MATIISQYTSNLKLELLDLVYDVSAAKIYALICWVHKYIKKAPGDFISTDDVYAYYITDFKTLNPNAIMPEKTFYKEIQSMLSANNLVLQCFCAPLKNDYVVCCKQNSLNIPLGTVGYIDKVLEYPNVECKFNKKQLPNHYCQSS